MYKDYVIFYSAVCWDMMQSLSRYCLDLPKLESLSLCCACPDLLESAYIIFLQL